MFSPLCSLFAGGSVRPSPSHCPLHCPPTRWPAYKWPSKMRRERLCSVATTTHFISFSVISSVIWIRMIGQTLVMKKIHSNVRSKMICWKSNFYWNLLFVCLIYVNSLVPDDAIWCQIHWLSLVWIMPCQLLSTKPLPKPMMNHSQFDP